MPTKFKVGDKVRFVQKSQTYMDFPIGTEATIIKISNGDMLWWECIVQLEPEATKKWGWTRKNDDGTETKGCQYAVFADLELVPEKPKYKFNIGDRVRCTKQNAWVPVGSIGTVDEYDDVPFVKWDNGDHYCLMQDELELMSDLKKEKVNIVIYRQENKVIAKMTIGKQVIAVGVAKCSPEDEFNWIIGSQIALQRMMKVAFDKEKAVLPKDTKMSDLFTY